MWNIFGFFLYVWMAEGLIYHYDTNKFEKANKAKTIGRGGNCPPATPDTAPDYKM